MGRRVLRLCVLSATLALGMLLSACGQPAGSGREDVVAFDALIASPRQYAGRYVCTEGIDVSGFESSGLAAAVQEEGSHPELTEPVIWLEGAEVQSRQDCIRTDTNPSFEFCQAVVCGVFEAGGGYGHGGAYAFQLRGRDVAAMPDATVGSAPVPTSPPAASPVDEPEPGADTPLAEPTRPVLTVAETAIVASEVDGPGHYEYTDRLGDDTLRRIEELRADAAERRLAGINADLAPFGYRLEARFDAEWNRTFHDLYRESQTEPLLPGLSNVWPVSVNASGTDFALTAENAPNVSPLYLRVQAGSAEAWDADQNAFLPPAYVGDALARVTFTGFPTLTYQVELDNRAVYTGTAVALGAYMPLHSFTTWDGHWLLEVDDHLIMDGLDLGQSLGYDAAFGFHLIQRQAFYFFEEGGQVRISYGGQTLPNIYDQVFHNQCCERAIHNVESLSDTLLFHALRDGTWYFVEVGVHGGEDAVIFRR